MRDQPIYSIEPDCNVYHNNTKCAERNNIQMHNMRVGTGGKKLCDNCRILNIEWERFVNNLSGRNVFNSLFTRAFFSKK